MMKEKMIEKIKDGANCAIHSMKGSKLTYLPENKTIDNAIIAMHIAQNKDKLAEAYYNYIVTCLAFGYSDTEIVAGIMQNAEQNKKFGVEIDAVINSVITIKTPVNLFVVKAEDPKPENPKPVKAEDPKPEKPENPKPVKAEEDKMNKIKGKIKHINNLSNGMSSSSNPMGEISKIKSLIEEVKDLISSLDRTKFNEAELVEIDASVSAFDAIVKMAEGLEALAKIDPTILSEGEHVGQAGAAGNTFGFNIANFFKPAPQPTPANPVKSVFPHEICGLSDEQIVEEVGKHFKLLPGVQLNAYPLYDLFNNKFLSNKMKELGAKQRPNNPFLTQVEMNKYIIEPELLNKFKLCFTMPCKDKDKVIVVLFNDVPEPNKNGTMQYPMHIFSAKKTNK